MIIQLSKPYESRFGTPVIDRAHPAIFELKYFARCMSCNFCHDWCCSYGADVDSLNAKRLLARADEIEKFVGISKEKWFDHSDTLEDYEAPGQLWLHTNVINGACVFLNRRGRGCLLHSFSLTNNTDYHELKPMICAIFPLTFEDGLLTYADEVEDSSLVCADQGLSLYLGVRKELEFYFGKGLIEELDQCKDSIVLAEEKSAF
jgi:Fe-S-cluster containining protein